MSSVWTVKPEENSIDLVFTDPDGKSHSFWIKVKRKLNVGEERHVMTAGWKGVSTNRRPGTEAGSPEVQIDWKTQSFARAAAYLTDWSLDDEKHVKLPLNLDTIESLHADVFALIENAITAHVEAVAQEKKVTNGEPAPSTT